jgi:hypothetical protein
VLELRHRWSDGTTHLAFEPVELLERLAALHPTAQKTRGGDPGPDAAAAGQSALLLRRVGGPERRGAGGSCPLVGPHRCRRPTREHPAGPRQRPPSRAGTCCGPS